MKTSTKIKWNNVPVNVPKEDVTLVMKNVCEALDSLGKQATLAKKEIDAGRIDRAKIRLGLIEEYSELYKEEVNL